jgi:hypothetical protein
MKLNATVLSALKSWSIEKIKNHAVYLALEKKRAKQDIAKLIQIRAALSARETGQEIVKNGENHQFKEVAIPCSCRQEHERITAQDTRQKSLQNQNCFSCAALRIFSQKFLDLNTIQEASSYVDLESSYAAPGLKYFRVTQQSIVYSADLESEGPGRMVMLCELPYEDSERVRNGIIQNVFLGKESSITFSMIVMRGFMRLALKDKKHLEDWAERCLAWSTPKQQSLMLQDFNEFIKA